MMRRQWMAIDERCAGKSSLLSGTVGCKAAVARKAVSRAALTAVLPLVVLGALPACSDDPRIPDGNHYSEEVIQQPGVVVIDDMEDGTQYILSDDGRVGLWYTYNDASPSGTQEPALGFPMYRTTTEEGDPDPSSVVPARPCGGGDVAPFFATEPSCKFVARTWGTGQSGWGAGMGVDLNGEGGVKNPFDASGYGGIGFFAIGSARANTLRVNVQDVRTTPESADAADRRYIDRCESFKNEDGSPTGRCNDHYGYNVTISPDTWKWIEIPFKCMTNGAWGYASIAGGGTPAENVLRRDAVVGVQFQITGADPDANGMLDPIQPFDFSIDNLSFLELSLADDATACPAP